MPALDRRALITPADQIWVAAFQWPDTEPFTWSVFSPDGVLLSIVRTPAGLEVTDAGDGWVLGVWRDALGIEQVRKYELVP